MRSASRPRHASERARHCRSHDQASAQVRARELRARVGGSRFLETDPVEGGSANDYDYGNADPVNSFDLDGQWPKCGWCRSAANAVGRGASAVGRGVQRVGNVASRVGGLV